MLDTHLIKCVPTGCLLLAGVCSEDKGILSEAWKRQPDANNVMVALQIVCETGQIHMVRDLVNRGARADVGSLWAACRNGSLETLQLLLACGAEITHVEVDMLRRYGHTNTIDALHLSYIS